MLTGVVFKAQSGFFWVQTAEGVLVSRLRGKLRQKKLATDVLAVGDRVQVEPTNPGEGQIVAVEPRVRQLSRRAPPPRREAEQVIVANLDQVIFVFACAHPAPRLRMLDRFLVIAEAHAIPALICVNKIDLLPPGEPEKVFAVYEQIGYPVLYLSVRQEKGIANLRDRLLGKLSVLAGPSGVGKSSLLNAVEPGLGLLARAISEATGKGRHTTVVPELIPLSEGGFVADTPGLKTLAFWDIQPEELDAYFVELRPYVSKCEFSDCTHLREPGCAVRAAVEAGAISPQRYDSFCRLRLGDDQE